MAEHGGRIVAKALKSRGVSHLFTLSGGHLFSIYDGCKAEGIEIVDVRHEQTAAFAAEGFAKATRRVGWAALTAGPGVTNGISAIAGAQANCSPVCVLGGRAPELRWGSGSLQEIDHLPFVAPLVKSAETVKETDRIAARTAAALDLSLSAPYGPTFVDYPLDIVFSEADTEIPALRATSRSPPRASRRRRRCLPAPSGRRSWLERPLLESRRGGVACLGRGARDPGLPQRARPRLPRRGPSIGLQSRPRRRSEGGRRGAGGRRSDRLPSRLRRQLRRGDEADPA
jgi:glyoxylate carboligase